MSARKPYYSAQRPGWWLHNSFFIWYMLREATSLFVGLYCAILLTGLYRLSQGESAWNNWLTSLAHPASIVFHGFVLTAALYHAITWFQLAPKIMLLRLGDWTLPHRYMLAGQWLIFALCSTTLSFVLLWLGD